MKTHFQSGTFHRPALNLLVISGFLFLAACGGNSGNNSSTGAANVAVVDDNGIPTYTFESNPDLEKAVEEFPVTCEGACPESSGTLLAAKGLQLSVCSFSLVGKDMVLTNRHCIPDIIAEAEASCAKNVRLIFMKNGVKEYFGCDKVVTITKNYRHDSVKNQPDFAFLKLQKPTNRKPLEISHAGVQDREVLTALTSTPGTDARNAHLIAKPCTVHMNSIVDGNFTNGFKPNVIMKNCDSVGGNSGSALVNSKGQLVGVLQGNFGDVEKSTSKQQRQLMTVLSKYKYAVGTNIVCAENKDLGLNLQHCDKNLATYTSPTSSETRLTFQAKMLEAQKRVDEQTTILKFKVDATAEGSGLESSANPTCIVGSAQNIPWLTEARQKVAQSQALLSIEFPRPSLRTEITEDAQSVSSVVVENVTLQFVIPVALIAKQSRPEFEIFPWINQQEGILAYTIPMCDQ